MQNQVVEAEIVNPSELTKSEPSVSLAKRENDPQAWLTPSEKYALTYFKESFQKGGASTYAIAPSVQAQLFTLYLNGRSLNEIRQLNHPAFSLGQIVHAAVEGDWYNQKAEYQSGLMLAARERLQQVGCESVKFLADSISAAHKQHGEALQKYLQSGNPADLGAFGIGSIRQYKEVLELLLKATGQDKTSTTNLNVQGEVLHTATESTTSPAGTKTRSLIELAAEKKSREKQ
jgi:hypothetical protein